MTTISSSYLSSPRRRGSGKGRKARFWQACRIPACAGITTLVLLGATAAYADDAATAATPTAAPAASSSPPSLMPSLDGPIAQNPDPLNVDTGYGKVYFGGIASGIAFAQTHATANDAHATGDLSNAALLINKPDGLVQFFLHVGDYSIPDLGVPYARSSKDFDHLFGPIAEGYLKLAPTDNFSIEAGVLPTLFGNEYTYSFENSNIERGLLWNQENDVNRGVQANYTLGPLAFSLSLNDGYYSDQYTWLTGSVAWTIDSMNTLTVDGGGNLAKYDRNTFATPVADNNQQLINAYLTHTNGPWTLTGALQFTHVPEYDKAGIGDDGETYGAGLYATYKFDDKSPFAGFSLPVRAEFIGSSGSAANGAPNLLYGQNSKALSLTFTPTYQYKVFYVRPEAAYVKAFNTTSGDAFGGNGNDTSQIRGMIEAGVFF